MIVILSSSGIASFIKVEGHKLGLPIWLVSGRRSPSPFVTGPAKINNVSTKNHKKSLIFLSLLYHNLRIIYTNRAKSLSLLQNLMGFLLKLTETGYRIQN